MLCVFVCVWKKFRLYALARKLNFGPQTVSDDAGDTIIINNNNRTESRRRGTWND